jgi:hypothetical protein
MGDWRSRISTLIVAIIATLLIWTWAADRTREVRVLTGSVLLRPADGARQFIDPAQPQAVTVTLKGSPATLNALQTRLEQGLALVPGTETLGAEPGQRTLNLASLIETSAEVRSTDASVTAVRPERIEVRVGAMVPVRMPVRAIAPLVTLRGDSEVDPLEVQVLVPEPSAGAASRETAEAVVDAKDLPEGSTHDVTAPLRLPESLKLAPTQAVFTPDRVKVRFTVAARSRSFTLPTVRVEVAGAPEDLKGFDVSFDEQGDLLRDVVLSAPGDALGPIEAGQARVVAIVHLGPEELSKRIPQKAVSAWVLPPGVQVESVGGKRPSEITVPLKIEPRAKPAEESPRPAAEPTAPKSE